MELAEVLRAAADAVEAAAVPADLRQPAFTKAVDLVLAGHVRARSTVVVADRERVPPAPPAPLAPPAAEGSPTAPDPEPEPPAPSAPVPSAEDRAGALASALGVPVERVDRLFDLHADEVHLSGDPARLGRTRAERVGSAVLLLLAALRWTGRDPGSGVADALVRAEVARLGLLDVGNYSKHLAARRTLWATTGSGRSATYRLRHDGLAQARQLARDLLDA